jgi:hypothetical protein
MTMATGIERPAMNPVDRVLSRLDDPRPTGPERWRCACPAHGGSNTSTLSVAVGENGAVLLRCWSGCALEDITAALGLNVLDLFPPKRNAGGGAPPCKRRRLISATQALHVLNSEANLVAITACNLSQGIALTAADRSRLLDAAERIAGIYREVHS